MICVSSREASAKTAGENGIIVNGEPLYFHVVSPEEEMEPADLVILITKMGGLEQAVQDVKTRWGLTRS